jgi:hypothetical protein
VRRRLQTGDNVAVDAGIVRVDVLDLALLETTGHEGADFDELSREGRKGGKLLTRSRSELHSAGPSRRPYVVFVLSFDRVKQALEPLERGSCGRVVPPSIPASSARPT